MSQTSIEVRKNPVQARSKARVNAILKTAKLIISEVGSDGLKMSALAARTKVPIGTVYQFFPNKAAVISTLVHETMDEIHIGLQDQLKGVQSLEDAANRLGEVIKGYCHYLREEPVAKDILSSTQGDKNLAELDHQDSARNGDLIFDILKPFVHASDHAALRTMCFMSAHLTGSLARLSAVVDRQTAEALEAQFITSTQRDLMGLKSS